MSIQMTIAEASKLAGLSAETIRHYERLGIMHPTRNDQNGYRYYTIIDLCLLGKIQSFLQCGFSLKEVKGMIKNMQLSDLEAIFESQTRDLEKEMSEAFKQLQGLRRKSRQINMIEANLDKFSIRTRPSMYLLETYKDNILLDDPRIEALHAAWFKRQIFTFPYVRWEDNSSVPGVHEYTQYVGFGIEQKDFEASKLEYNSLMKEYPEMPCVYTVLAMSNTNKEMQADIAGKIDAYLQDNHLQQSGDILFETVFISESDEKPLYYRNVWIPFK